MSLTKNALNLHNANLCTKCSSYDWHYIVNRRGSSEDLKAQDDAADFRGSDDYSQSARPGVFYKTGHDTRIYLGSLKEMRQNKAQCSLCRFLLEVVEPGIALEVSIDPEMAMVLTQPEMAERPFICLIDTPEYPWDYFHMKLSGGPKGFYRIRDAHILSASGSCRYGRVTSPSQINIQLVRQWWQDCQRYHRKVCHTVHKQVNLANDKAIGNSSELNYIRVIDVKEKRVIVAPAACKYVALSYVWGSAVSFRAGRKEFLDPHQNGEELSDAAYLSLNMDLIPQTIADAMLVVESIGESYLWVDALCIIQDDEVEKMKMISVMDGIYARALLTIVAAGGAHSNSGLQGLHAGSRNRKQLTVTIGGVGLLVEQESCKAALSRSKWATRAWTYQEQHFSKKCLVFAEGRVYYNCKCAQWSEDVTEGAEFVGTGEYEGYDGDYDENDSDDDADEGDDDEDEDEDDDDERGVRAWSVFRNWGSDMRTKPTTIHTGISGTSSSKWRSVTRATEKKEIVAGPVTNLLSRRYQGLLQSYTTHVEEYSTRQLSYPDDIENAFAGVLREYERKGFTFCGCLPTEAFTEALLWKMSSFTRGKSIQGELKPSERRRRQNFPSWSWTGWEGPIQMPYGPESVDICIPATIVWPWSSQSRIIDLDDRADWQNGRLVFEAETAMIDGSCLSYGIRRLSGERKCFCLGYCEEGFIVMVLRTLENGDNEREDLMICRKQYWKQSGHRSERISLV